MRLLVAALLLACQASAAPHHAPPEKQVLAPGYGRLDFVAPPAGSYKLPSLGTARDGQVVDTQGRALRLNDLLGEKLVLMSFIYANCDDVNGCPLASFVLSRVQDRIAEQGLSEQVRLVSLSFDRQNDTPEILKQYGDNFRDPGFDWHFLTTPSDDALEGILDDYNQFIIVDRNENGEPIGTISHLLRVYLIDPDRRFRNIYSVSFLHPDIIVNDINTILMERSTQ